MGNLGTYTHICYACMYTNIYTYQYIERDREEALSPMYLCSVSVYFYPRVNVSTFVCMKINMYACIDMCLYTHACISACMYMHMHANVRIRSIRSYTWPGTFAGLPCCAAPLSGGRASRSRHSGTRAAPPSPTSKFTSVFVGPLCL